MRNSEFEMQLPDSVERLLAELSRKNKIKPAQNAARQRLAGLGEQEALSLLRNIWYCSIGDLTALIISKAKFVTPSFPLPTCPANTCNLGSQHTVQDYDKGSPISFSLSGGSVTCSTPCSSRAGTECDWESVDSHLSFTESEWETVPSDSNFDEPLCDGCSTDEFSDAQATLSHSVNELYSIRGESRQTCMHGNWNSSKGTKDSITTKPSELPVFTEHQKALGKLDFPKAFFVLSSVTPYALEKVLSVDFINGLQDLPMVAVESNLRQELAMKLDSVSHFERKKYDWDPNKMYKYHCHVDREGNCVFKGPSLANTGNHLQRVLGDSNVLQVHFAEELLREGVDQNKKNGSAYNKYKPSIDERNTYHRLAKEGIFVGLRLYQFFVFKDGGKERRKNPMSSSVKCYFVCTKSFAEVDEKSPYILFNKSIDEARCLFMHVHTVASLEKYISRFTLILSKTIPFGGCISDVNFIRVADIPCLDENKMEVYDLNGELLIHTNGTGFISEDLASQCPKNLYEGKHLSNQISEACPLLIQCRLFYNGYAVKGTFLVNRRLPYKTIHFRESMIKVERDENYVRHLSINALEICRTSYKPSTACLSRRLIALLAYGGVPRDFFIELVINAIEKIQNELKDQTKAWKVVKQYRNLDGDHVCLRMLSCGIPLHEPLLKHRLKYFMQMEIKKFKEGKVALEDSYYLMGTADPTGKLGPNQVCIILDHGQVSGKVLVYRNPGLHFGDLHLCKATYVEEIEKVVGDSKFGIFFSTQGPRSMADEIAKGDFDGDMYWVCMNAKVLKHFKPESPWMRPVQDRGASQPKPTDFSPEKLEKELFEEFLNTRFAPSNAISVAAESWLVFMDRLLTPKVTNVEECEGLKQKMQKLTNIHYEALDAPKTGKKVEVPKDLQPEKKPHFLCKNPEDICLDKFYMSASVLGEIYDKASSYDAVESYEIWTIPCFQDANVGELRTVWREHYVQYKLDMAKALSGADSLNSALDSQSVILKYRQLLYGAASLDESKKERQQIHKEACAIYQVVYEYATSIKDTSKCLFAWRVAGEALCEIYFLNHQKQPILISTASLYDILP